MLLSFLLLCNNVYSQKVSVYFDFNKYTLSQESIDTLEKCLSILEKNKKQIHQIRISGYCDSVGGTDYNQKLSLRRAESVSKYFANKNYDIDTIIIRGVGKENPLYSNDTENDRAKNRRVDVFFVTQKSIAKPAQKTITEVITTGQVGTNILLKNINFHPGTAILLNTSMPDVETLVQILKDNTMIEIQIEGHICCAEDEYNIVTKKNDLLSTQRAETIYQILIQKGINKSRLSCIGYGHSRPLTEERTEEERIRNRRVEIKITKNW